MSPDLTLLLVGAAVAGLVQGLSGFAFGMVAMSFWVWGIDPRVASVLTVFGALTGQVVAAFSIQRGLRLAVLLPFLVGGLVGVPIGVAVLPHLDTVWFKLILGTLLVTWCPTMLFAQRLPRVQWGGRFANGLAGAAGGFMGGLGGFTGVVPSLWCTLRGFDKALQRTVVQNFNLAALSVTMVAYLMSGAVTRDMIPLFAVLAPTVLISSLIGARLYIGLSELAFRRIVLSLLTLAGLTMLVSSLARLLS
ncbi:MAG: sulfite exporter TauE/SafE family protein [Rhodoferax sp.]|nr:sulfite exporter TauE/SafE family protein [Rhodoferax sp.]MBK9236833.1 sulfite exporter TauE/SafE family protein [Rhodoferax sp.]